MAAATHASSAARVAVAEFRSEGGGPDLSDEATAALRLRLRGYPGLELAAAPDPATVGALEGEAPCDVDTNRDTTGPRAFQYLVRGYYLQFGDFVQLRARVVDAETCQRRPVGVVRVQSEDFLLGIGRLGELLRKEINDLSRVQAPPTVSVACLLDTRAVERQPLEQELKFAIEEAVNTGAVNLFYLDNCISADETARVAKQNGIKSLLTVGLSHEQRQEGKVGVELALLQHHTPPSRLLARLSIEPQQEWADDTVRDLLGYAAASALSALYSSDGTVEPLAIAALQLDDLDGLFALGDEAVGEGKLDVAALSFLRATVIEPKSLKGYLKQAGTQVELKNFDQAAEYFGQALELDERSAEARIGLAHAYLSKGALEDAERHYHDVLAQDDGNPDAFRGLGDIALFNGDTPKAIEFYHKAIDANPNDASAFARLGLVNRREGKLADAIVALEQALGLKPESDDYRSELAGLYDERGGQQLREGNPHGAANDYTRGVELNPSPILYGKLAYAYSVLGEMIDEKTQTPNETYAGNLKDIYYDHSIRNYKLSLGYFDFDHIVQEAKSLGNARSWFMPAVILNLIEAQIIRRLYEDANEMAGQAVLVLPARHEETWSPFIVARVLLVTTQILLDQEYEVELGRLRRDLEIYGYKQGSWSFATLDRHVLSGGEVAQGKASAIREVLQLVSSEEVPG